MISMRGGAGCAALRSTLTKRAETHTRSTCPHATSCSSGAAGGPYGEEPSKDPNGRLKILKWLHANGCPWDEQTCTEAAGAGHLECLKWLHTNECPWNEETCAGAAFGHLECLKVAARKRMSVGREHVRRCGRGRQCRSSRVFEVGSYQRMSVGRGDVLQCSTGR